MHVLYCNAVDVFSGALVGRIALLWHSRGTGEKTISVKTWNMPLRTIKWCWTLMRSIQSKYICFSMLVLPYWEIRLYCDVCAVKIWSYHPSSVDIIKKQKEFQSTGKWQRRDNNNDSLNCLVDSWECAVNVVIWCISLIWWFTDPFSPLQTYPGSGV